METATLKAVSCLEIIETIFDFLSPTSPKQSTNDETHHTLAGLARTCKTFHDPALRVLWRKLYDTRPVFRLFSQYITRSRDPSGRSRNTAELTRKPSDLEWARIQSYTARIRDIRLSAMTASEDAPMWPLLFKLTDGKPLFPRLEILREFCVTSSDIVVTARLLIPPTVRHLVFHGDIFLWEATPPHIITPAIEAAAVLAPRLERFAMEYLSVSEPTSLHPIVALKGLHTLSIDDHIILNTHTLALFGSLESLQDFSAHIQLANAGKETEKLRGGYRSLKRISLGGSAEDLAMFFQLCPLPVLQSLSLAPGCDCEVSVVCQHLALILKSVPRDLTTLKLSDKGHFSSEEHVRVRPLIDILNPVLDLSSLTEVDIRFGRPFVYYDSDVLNMLDAWPLLRVLKLSIPSHRGSPCRLSPQLLETIAVRYRDLHSLSLPLIDFSKLPRVPAGMPVVGHGLEQLRFSAHHLIENGQWQGKVDWLNAAVYIDRLFPLLDVSGVRDPEFAVDMHREERGEDEIFDCMRNFHIGRDHQQGFESGSVKGVLDVSGQDRLPPLAW